MTELTSEQIDSLGDELEKHPVHRLQGFKCTCGEVLEYYNPDFMDHVRKHTNPRDKPC